MAPASGPWDTLSAKPAWPVRHAAKDIWEWKIAMERRPRIAIIRPPVRHLIARDVRHMVLSGKIVVIPSDDDMLWCIVNMRQAAGSLPDVLAILTELWGSPIPFGLGSDESVYLFNLLEGRIRNSAN